MNLARQNKTISWVERDSIIGLTSFKRLADAKDDIDSLRKSESCFRGHKLESYQLISSDVTCLI